MQALLFFSMQGKEKKRLHAVKIRAFKIEDFNETKILAG